MADRRKEAKEYKEGPDRRKDAITANLIHARFVWGEIQAGATPPKGTPNPEHKERAKKDRRQAAPGWEFGHVVADRRKAKDDRRKAPAV